MPNTERRAANSFWFWGGGVVKFFFSRARRLVSLARFLDSGTTLVLGGQACLSEDLNHFLDFEFNEGLKARPALDLATQN